MCQKPNLLVKGEWCVTYNSLPTALRLQTWCFLWDKCGSLHLLRFIWLVSIFGNFCAFVNSVCLHICPFSTFIWACILVPLVVTAHAWLKLKKMGMDLGVWDVKQHGLADLACNMQHGETWFSHLGQLKLARPFWIKIMPNHFCRVLNTMQK